MPIPYLMDMMVVALRIQSRDILRDPDTNMLKKKRGIIASFHAINAQKIIPIKYVLVKKSFSESISVSGISSGPGSGLSSSKEKIDPGWDTDLYA